MCRQDSSKVSPNLPAGIEKQMKFIAKYSCLVLESESWTELGCDKVLRFGGHVPVQTPNVSEDVYILFDGLSINEYAHTQIDGTCCR